MLELIRQSGSMVNTPDNSTGFGIPNYNRIAVPDELKEGRVLIVNPVRDNEVLLYLGNDWQGLRLKVQVYDITGKRVWQENLLVDKHRQVLGLDASSLKQGVYLCRLQSGSLNTTVKFVKL